MIIDNNSRSSFKARLPFSANFDKEKMTVSFSEGHVFDCYNYNLNPEGGYKNGSNFTKIAGGQKFNVALGDHFYATNTAIEKVSKAERESGVASSGVLIWKAPTEEEGEEQAYSENLFLQDYELNRNIGFAVKKIKEEEEEVTYKISSGFVFCPQLGYSKFIKGFEIKKRVDEPIPSFELKVSVSASLSATDVI